MVIILSVRLAEIKSMAKPGLEPAKRRFNVREGGRRQFLDKKIELALFYFYYHMKGCEKING